MTATMDSVPSDRVEAMDLATNALKYASRAQHEDHNPSHSDWRALHAGVVHSLQHLIELTEVLARQMPHYGSDKILCADNAEQGGNPYRQIIEAACLTSETKHHLERARQAAHRSWAHIRHVDVAADPNLVIAED
ncbi:hypothetical protein [Amycolatopsis pigmentata]|uniref:Uncharacterized protein n=1 Tax=Amycolatopsis pigmentata TaxID=450801 RepID=A0ABW5G9D0_9PSEU